MLGRAVAAVAEVPLPGVGRPGRRGRIRELHLKGRRAAGGHRAEAQQILEWRPVSVAAVVIPLVLSP